MSQNVLNGVKGALWGVLVGAILGGGLWLWIFKEPPFFEGDVIVISVVVCATLGYFFGERFLDWIEENWTWFP